MASPRAILTAGWAVFLVYAWPGYMSWDSTTQLAQARRHHYTDDHPPVMAILWRFLEHFVHGPLPMLLVISIGFVWGLYKLLEPHLRPRNAAIATIVILWFPPTGTILAVILKDSMMAACLMPCVPLLLSRRFRWAGLVLAGAATTFRYNGPAATFPLVVLLYRFRESIGWRRYAIALVAWIGVTGVALAIPRFVADEETHYWYWSNALQDIAGTLQFSRDYPDAELEAMFEGGPLVVHDHIQDKFRAIYQPVDFRHLDNGDARVLDLPTTEAHRSAIARAWRTLVLGNLGAYLHYRWQNFAALMRFDHAVYVNVIARFTAFHHEDEAFVEHDASASHVQHKIAGAMVALSRTPLFDPSVYLVLALLLIPFVLRLPVAAAMLASGLCYEASFFLLAPTADYRYSQWFITATLTALVLIFSDRYRRQTTVR